MKTNSRSVRQRSLLAAAAICALAIAAFVFLLARAHRSASATGPSAVGAGNPALAPSAPLSRASAGSQSQPAQSASHAQTDALQYDPTVSFATNLERFKQFLGQHENDASVALAVDRVGKALVRNCKDQFPAVRTALEKNDGVPVAKLILLGCLMAADGPAEEKSGLAWGLAADRAQDASVRRTATYVTGLQDSQIPRPEAYRALLTDPDEDLVVFALTCTNRNVNLDRANYDLIKMSLIDSANVHVRVAAVNAVGMAPFSDAQDVVRAIVTNTPTAGVAPFSQPTLAKRAAIMLLDGASSSNQRLVQAMALDDTEEPGVRAKAILKMAEARTPEVEAALKDLLERFAENDLVPLAAVVDGIMREPSPANLSLVRDKIQNMADPQVKKILLSRVEIGTGKETP